MSTHTDALNQRITRYLTEIHTLKNRAESLESEIKDLKKEISRQGSLLKKVRGEKAACRKELLELKKAHK